jgi:carboxymethylenebutenolidase
MRKGSGVDLMIFVLRKLGSIGFCMGGGLSLALATHLANTSHPLVAAVTCYGTPPKDIFDVREITKSTPVQGHFGAKVSLKVIIHLK